MCPFLLIIYIYISFLISPFTFILVNPQNGILLIPGITGSVLYSTLTDAYIPECSSSYINESRSQIWLSLLEALPPKSHQDCWLAKLHLNYTEIGNCTPPLYNDCRVTYTPLTGVTVEPDPPGAVNGIDYLDEIYGFGVPNTKYFHDIIEKFYSVGYQYNETLFGYSFDWRYPIWQHEFTGLRTLIESFKQKNPDKKILIISHSLGSLLVNLFLTQHVSDDWKSKHVSGFISISGAFGGSHKTIAGLLSGSNEYSKYQLLGLMDVPLLPRDSLMAAQRSFGSMFNLLPNPKVFSDNYVIIQVKNDSSINSTKPYQPYTLADWWLLLPDELHSRAIDAFKRLVEGANNGNLDDPKVNVYCYWSTLDEPSTETAFIYESNDITNDPTPVLSVGDGTLSVTSSSYCTEWVSTIDYAEIKNVDHMKILFDKKFITKLLSIATNLPESFLENYAIQ